MKAPQMPSRGGVLTRLAIAAVVGAIIVVCFVLPAEYRKDPTGIGRALGLFELTTPVVEKAEEPAATPSSVLSEDVKPAVENPDASQYHKTYAKPWRSETIEIPIGPDGELEYKVKMAAGQSMVYSWQVNRGSVYYDFHGEPTGNPKGSKSYLEVQETKDANGVFIAPFDGIHGWYWLNLEPDPIKVTLKISGFYESHGEVK